MRFVSGSLLLLSSFALLTGCSDNGGGSSSSNVSSIEGWVGAQEFSHAQVVVNRIAESGQVSLDTSGIYAGVRESTDSRSRFTASIIDDETTLLIARGQIADVDEDRDNLATQRQCQLALGCSVSGVNYNFSDFYPATEGFEWRGVVYAADDDSRNNVNAITTLAAAFAYKFDVKYGYDNHSSHDHSGFETTVSDTFANELFTPYDVVLANSQTANILGLMDIIGDLPANLTQLNGFNEDTLAVRNQIRYGALLAGLQKLELEYSAENNQAGAVDFISKVAAQFAEDNGQFYYHGSEVERALTLQKLYEAAHDNLKSIAAGVANEKAKAVANTVIAQLAADLENANAMAANSKTSGVADELSQLLTATEVEEFRVGLEKTKLFVQDLLSFQQAFWQTGYQSELDGYLALLKMVGDEHSDNLNDLATEFARIQSYYVNCKIAQPIAEQCGIAYTPGSLDPEGASGLLDIANLAQEYDPASKTLILKSGVLASGMSIFKPITVSQKIADLNLLDANDTPSRSQAIDIYITGELEKSNLVLTLAHSYDSAGESIDIPSAMRIYYPEEVSEVPSSVLEIQGYELIWGAFQLYDKSKLNQDYDPSNPLLGAELELSGSFRIFYRGVRDPQNANSELRFNIENWDLSSTISDQVDDTVGTDRELTSLVISGNSSNPDGYYPAQKLASFDGFFKANNDHQVGAEIADLLTYRLGTEQVAAGRGSIDVQTIDFINAHNDDVRYRFYPSERVVDEYDSNRNGNITEVVDMHRVEECQLNASGKVESCGSKSRIYDKVDIQKTINDLWELGLFQRIPVDGHGTYFVDFPTTTNADGCLVLDTLSNDQGPMSGRLIEQQVLGLDSVNFFTEIKIEDADSNDLPSTLLNVSIVAPTKDKYRIVAGLSHNYSSADTESTEVILGAGSSASTLLVSYDTTADFENAGNVTVAKGGVTLTLNDPITGTATTVAEDQDITAFLSQRYDPASVNYKIIENSEGQAERCVTSVGSNYEKNPEQASQVFYLNYRDVIYGTIRPEGPNGIWTIRYIDGSWMIPAAGSSGI